MLSSSNNNESPDVSEKSTVRERHSSLKSRPTGSGGSNNRQPMTGGMVVLADNFKPGKYDVICARGKAAKSHVGNQWFRSLVGNHLQQYSNCESKLEKSFVVSSIIKTVRQHSPKGGFVKQCTTSKDGKQRWMDVGERIAREKIGQAFRDMLHTQYRSSTKAKATLRRQKSYTTATTTSGNNLKEQRSVSTTPRKRSGENKDITRKPKSCRTSHSSASSRNDLTTTTSSVFPDRVRNTKSVNMPSLAISENPQGQHQPQAFPPLPNLNQCSVGGASITSPLHPQPAAASLPSLDRNHSLCSSIDSFSTFSMNNNNELDKTNSSVLLEEEPPMIHPQLLSGTGSGSNKRSIGSSSSTHSHPLDSTTIHEMYQAQLFASEDTLASNNSSGSASSCTEIAAM